VEDNVHVGNEIVISTLVVGNPQSFIPYLGNTLRYTTCRMLTQCPPPDLPVSFWSWPYR